jgi:pimeloyl-ACP methyl ester carboxylesterase
VVTVKRLLPLFLMVFAIFAALPLKGFAQNKNTIGIILLHGKAGSPRGHIAKLANELRTRGYEVSTPDMPWASGEIYGASFKECLDMIGDEVKSLRERGIQTVVIAGHSLGAHMALAYAATDQTLAGVILLAPGHYPESYANRKKTVMDSLEDAKALMDKGSGEQKVYFNDMNNGEEITVLAKPANYLSFLDPDGPGRMSTAVRSFKHSMPVLLIAEKNPKNDPKETIYDLLPKNTKSRLVQSAAEHMDVPDTSANEILNWLKSLDLSI